MAAAAAAAEGFADISFSLHPTAGSAARLEKPYLRTSNRLTAGHLKKYLAKKMRLSAGGAEGGDGAAAAGSGVSRIEVYCRDVALEAHLTLDAIARIHWKEEDDLVLTYHVAPA
mmetsp:Transcript_10724/g.33963  ORF Transcript_10724/g.33963 Transcript_10724/m.33963 type:complete len:114 (+) Transcript_10724:660-1001(+)